MNTDERKKTLRGLIDSLKSTEVKMSKLDDEQNDEQKRLADEIRGFRKEIASVFQSADSKSGRFFLMDRFGSCIWDTTAKNSHLLQWVT